MKGVQSEFMPPERGEKTGERLGGGGPVCHRPAHLWKGVIVQDPRRDEPRMRSCPKEGQGLYSKGR